MSGDAVRVSVLRRGTASPSEELRAGLVAKDFSPWPKYFYDERGSALFEEITRQPEYYQTRTELSILRERAGDILRRTGSRELVELGSGSASKTRVLIEAMLSHDGGPVRYVPLDVSESALRASGTRLSKEYPGLEVRGYVGDFHASLGDLLAEPASGERLILFLGGTVGNFTPERRRVFLSKLRAGMEAGDHLLLGVDLVKDPDVIEAAYDDAAGVTARFNRNLLHVVNRHLGTDLDPHRFEHRAFYDAEESRVEMWLDARMEQGVWVGEEELVHFEAGEGMRTEISAKFSPHSVEEVLREAGLSLVELYTDGRGYFALALAGVR